MTTTQFNVPSTILVGGGVSQQLAAQAARLGGRRELLVTDATMVASGLAGRCVDQLKAANIPAAVFSGVQPDPTDKNVAEGLALLRRENCDLVIGLGGGSPMDAAKVIAVAATNDAPIREFAGYHRIAKPGLPLILIPTTAGTGSEVTKVAVVTDTERDVKMMMLDAHLLARVALVDYELSLTMPTSLTAHVGVDTLTHGIEAYVSRKANALTDPLAAECIRLTASHLFTAWKEPGNRPAREAMMLAACLGGMAFANSSVCLVHGMSRPIGAIFHLAHGLSNALLLPEITQWSLRGAVPRYAQVARWVGAAADTTTDDEAAATLPEYLARLNGSLGIGRLRDFIKARQEAFDQKLPAMAEAALASGSPQNNPIMPSVAEIIELYRKVW
ncbi:MAG: iron-containing alcohol dehydrogenase [Verrucomicrobia bacterium]|nr:iron-containing alcohol dehydrogenase [Verrucomicrobiota bacterium]